MHHRGQEAEGRTLDIALVQKGGVRGQPMSIKVKFNGRNDCGVGKAAPCTSPIAQTPFPKYVDGKDSQTKSQLHARLGNNFLPAPTFC